MSSQAQRQKASEACARKCLDVILDVTGDDFAAMHNIAFNLLDSIEVRMRQKGLSIPTYTRKLGGQTRANRGNFTLCKRCTCCAKDKKGYYCSEFYAGPHRQRFYIDDADGCARGIPRKEYR